MALTDDVILRIPSQVLVEKTNPRDSSATSNDSTVLAQAASSVEAYFETYTQEPYDGTIAIHLEVAVRGVSALLDDWGAGDSLGSSEFWEKFKSECEMIRNTRSRARITPTTSSQLTPSDENPTGGEVKPWADDRFLAPLHVRRQGTDTTDDGT